MKIFLPILFVFAAVLNCASTLNQLPFQNYSSIVKVSNDIGWRIFGQANTTSRLVSPLSAMEILGILYVGSIGETRENIRKVLKMSEYSIKDDEAEAQFGQLLQVTKTDDTDAIDSNALTMMLANRIYASKPLLTSFQTIVKQRFNADAKSANFAQDAISITNEINAWVYNATHGKISDVLQENLSAQTRIVLLSALYFKSQWKQKFDKNLTQKGWFMNEGTKNVTGMKMSVKGTFRYAKNKTLNATIVEIPYAGDQFAMYVVLPLPNQTLDAVEKIVITNGLDPYLEKLRIRKMKLLLPRFMISAKLTLEDHLKKLGIDLPFQMGKADFTLMDGSKDLAVTSILQKTILEVNEEGSEAAAASAVVVSFRSLMQDDFVIDVNQPCLLSIKHLPSGLDIFVGRLAEIKPVA